MHKHYSQTCASPCSWPVPHHDLSRLLKHRATYARSRRIKSCHNPYYVHPALPSHSELQPPGTLSMPGQVHARNGGQQHHHA